MTILRQATFRSSSIEISTGEEEGKKWIAFTCINKRSRRITKIFMNTNFRIALKANNTTERNLYIRAQKSGKLDRYNNTTVYQLK
jgi:hypothetical protein